MKGIIKYMIKEKKDCYLRVRLTENDLQILKETAEEHGISLSKYVRMLLEQDLILLEIERHRNDENE